MGNGGGFRGRIGDCQIRFLGEENWRELAGEGADPVSGEVCSGRSRRPPVSQAGKRSPTPRVHGKLEIPLNYDNPLKLCYY